VWYPPWTINRVEHDVVEKSSKSKQRKQRTQEHKGMVVVPYVKGLSYEFAKILKSHSIIATANRPHRTLWNFVDEEKTEVVYSYALEELLQLIHWGDRQEVCSEDQGAK